MYNADPGSIDTEFSNEDVPFDKGNVFNAFA